MTCECSCYDSGYDDGHNAGVEDTLHDTVDGTSSRLIEVFALNDRLYIEKNGEFSGIDTRTGNIVETRFRVPNGARRVNYAR